MTQDTTLLSEIRNNTYIAECGFPTGEQGNRFLWTVSDVKGGRHSGISGPLSDDLNASFEKECMHFSQELTRPQAGESWSPFVFKSVVETTDKDIDDMLLPIIKSFKKYEANNNS